MAQQSKYFSSCLISALLILSQWLTISWTNSARKYVICIFYCTFHTVESWMKDGGQTNIIHNLLCGKVWQNSRVNLGCVKFAKMYWWSVCMCNIISQEHTCMRTLQPASIVGNCTYVKLKKKTVINFCSVDWKALSRVACTLKTHSAKSELKKPQPNWSHFCQLHPSPPILQKVVMCGLQPNGEVASTSGLTKRAASCDERLIVMEEVAPMRTPLRSGIRIFLADLFISDRYSATNVLAF